MFKKMVLEFVKINYFYMVLLITACLGASVCFKDSLLVLFREVAGLSEAAKVYDTLIVTLSGTLIIILLSKVKHLIVIVQNFIKNIGQLTNIDICEQLYKVEQSINDMVNSIKDLATQVLDISQRLDTAVCAIDKIESLRNAERSNLIELESVKKDKMFYLAKLSPVLQAIGNDTINNLIAWILSFHKQGFYVTDALGNRKYNPTLNKEVANDDLIGTAHVLKKALDVQFEKDLVERIYTRYINLMQSYSTYVCKLIDDTDNFKHPRFQEKSLLVLDDFIKILYEEYLEFIKKV